MKRKLLISVLALVLFVTSGCGGSVNVPAYKDATAKTTTEASKKAEDQEEAAAEPVTTGGYPWINSDLKSNIKADAKLSPKDDFYLYVNHDQCLNTEFKDKVIYGASEISAEKTNDKAMLLLKDDTLKSHDADLVQSLNNALLDWESRNAAGLEPVMKTVQNIQDIKNLEELSDFISDPEIARSVPTFLAIHNRVSLDDTDRYVTCIETDPLALNDADEYTARTEMGDRQYEASAFLTRAMLTRLGYSEAESDKMFADMIAFEGKIAENR